MSETLICNKCDNNINKTDKRHQYSNTSGSQWVNCSKCGNHNEFFLGFYCSICDIWYDGRMQLKSNPNKGVIQFLCPNCDGLIRKGEILDVKQDQY